MVDSHGRFVRYELMTSNVEAAKAFYSAVVGWGTKEISRPGSAYVQLTAGDAMIGGLVGLPAQAMRMGVRPSWIGYVSVADVDGATKVVKDRAGAVFAPPHDIPGIGRFAIVADPQGAMLALVSWLRPPQNHAAENGGPGHVGWHELLAAEWEKVWSFYADLFGWQEARTDASAMGAYRAFSAGGRTVGGMFSKPPTAPVPYWLYYFNISDIDAATRQVRTSGGQILNGPVQVTGGTWVAQCADPQGAIFGLIGNRNPLTKPEYGPITLVKVTR